VRRMADSASTEVVAEVPEEDALQVWHALQRGDDERLGLLCSAKNLANLHRITDKLEKDRFNDKPAHVRLKAPKQRMPARKNAELARPTSAAESVPRLERASRVLDSTTSVKMRSLPESQSTPALFAASVSKLGLPLEASVSWRSQRAPPWAPLNVRERQLLERSLQERAELTLSMRLEAERRGVVPMTTKLLPKWNSAQLGLYEDWPRGLLRPSGDGYNVKGLHPLGLQGSYSGDGKASRRILSSFDLSASLQASRSWTSTATR